MLSLIISCLCLASVPGVPAGGPAPRFTEKPIATRQGERVKITFAVDRETDVAVYIEDAEGNIVRHLVAGVPGRNPPPPLRPGSLRQTLHWDGTDDLGRPLPEGRYRVRVCAGLRVRYAGTAFSDRRRPNHIGGAAGLAVGPDAPGRPRWLVMFGKMGRVRGRVRYRTPAGRTQHLVVDLVPGTRYRVSPCAGGARELRASGQGTLRFATDRAGTVSIAPARRGEVPFSSAGGLAVTAAMGCARLHLLKGESIVSSTM